jgi:hypothetical protein
MLVFLSALAIFAFAATIVINVIDYKHDNMLSKQSPYSPSSLFTLVPL